MVKCTGFRAPWHLGCPRISCTEVLDLLCFCGFRLKPEAPGRDMKASPQQPDAKQLQDQEQFDASVLACVLRQANSQSRYAAGGLREPDRTSSALSASPSLASIFLPLPEDSRQLGSKRK